MIDARKDARQRCLLQDGRDAPLPFEASRMGERKRRKLSKIIKKTEILVVVPAFSQRSVHDQSPDHRSADNERDGDAREHVVVCSAPHVTLQLGAPLRKTVATALRSAGAVVSSNSNALASSHARPS